MTSKPVQLEIYKPITYDTLRRACISSSGFPVTPDVLLFGIRQPLREHTGPQRHNAIHVNNVVHIIVREGGGVLPPADGRGFDAQSQGQELKMTYAFELDIKQARPDHLVVSTINLVLDFAKFGWGSDVTRNRNQPKVVEFSLICHPHVLNTFIAAVSTCDYSSA